MEEWKIFVKKLCRLNSIRHCVFTGKERAFPSKTLVDLKLREGGALGKNLLFVSLRRNTVVHDFAYVRTFV